MKTQSTKIYFSYSQFMVFDESELLPGCEWTELHSNQGFARRLSTVCFGTLLEFGHACVTVLHEQYNPHNIYDRVISVPFLSVSGIVCVEGPEELNSERVFQIPAGNYRLTAAQKKYTLLKK